MIFLSNPKWIKAHNFDFKTVDEVPDMLFDSINIDLRRIIGEEPLVSILIPVWNEEINVLRCISSLSKLKVDFPIEIIVINNNSTDKTQVTIDKLEVKGLFEIKQGPGPARQLGMEKAKGKFILLADGDCFYPPFWVHDMLKILSQKNVSCVYGRYSFISEPGFPRWKLYLFEKMKDLMAEIRQINRAYLNAYGLNMGFIREFGLKIGFIDYNLRGEDGILCLNLMQYGKVLPVRKNRARAWTGPRTLMRDGHGFTKALLSRIIKELKRVSIYFNGKVSEEDYRRKK